MFKAGDKVVVVSTDNENWYRVGQTYVVAGINDCVPYDTGSIGKDHVTLIGEEKNICILCKHIELVKENNMNANWKDNLETMCSEELVDLIAKAEEQLKLIREEKEKPLRDVVSTAFEDYEVYDTEDIFKALYENASEFIEALEHVKGK